MNPKNYILITLCFLTVVFCGTGSIFGRSVYVINNTNTSQMQAYKINGTSLTYQTYYDFISETWLSVGIAIDESEYGQFLFATFETSNKIEVVNAKTMQYVDTVEAPDPYGTLDLAGVVVDKNSRKMYVINRRTNNLYVYSWDAATKELTLDLPNPYYVELEDCEQGYSLALDEENDLLYVADNTDEIKYYDTNDPNWLKKGEIPVSCNVISIAIDVNNQLLYYGSMGAYGEGDPCLYQYDISAQTEDSVTVGCSVAGIAVDKQTSLVYLTTFGGQDDTNEPYPKDRLMVYDSSLQQLWYSDDIGNPSGVAVAGNVSYKPPFPLVTLVKDVNDGNCVSPLISEAEHEFMEEPYNWLYYNIHYDANGHADTNVFITDYLPVEVDYNSSDPNGVYDPCMRTVTWNIPVMAATDFNTFRIQVGVNHYARPGETIINLCEI